jgi:hypothetical protein
LLCVFIVLLAYTALILILSTSSNSASAGADSIFGPACGKATIDGIVDPDEWSSASKQTFLMESPVVKEPFTATLYVMNSGNNLYMGITINDDEFTPVGTWLPQGDGFRIDFDNNHSGALFALYDDVLIISAGLPQFKDDFIMNSEYASAALDKANGGTSDGFGMASRVGDLNHFELKHPLCSRDALDFCLHPTKLVGFRLEYLDAQADGKFGGSQFFPGHDETSIADLAVGECLIPDWFIHLPFIRK